MKHKFVVICIYTLNIDEKCQKHKFQAWKISVANLVSLAIQYKTVLEFTKILFLISDYSFSKPQCSVLSEEFFFFEFLVEQDSFDYLKQQKFAIRRKKYRNV